MPGRHTAIADDFQHGISPAYDFVVVRERKRSNFAFTVTLDAVPVENSHDLIGKRYRTVGIRFSHSSDETANYFRGRSLDIARRQQIIDRVSDKRLLRFVTNVANAVLVVDTAVVPYYPVFIEDQDFRRPCRSDLIGNPVIQILQNRKTHLVNSGVS